MYNSLKKPSLATIRTRFIQEGLRQYPNWNAVPVRVGATGRTGSGKSTLGNRLLGSDHFLKSDGHINCTNHINMIRFSSQLEYMDLPGVSSDDKLENYNRAALGIAQVANWPKVDTLTIATYTDHSQPQEEHFPVEQFSQQQFRPDILLYLVAPHQKLSYSDTQYMIDLLQHYGSERVIFVLNLFTDKASTRISVSTPQDIKDSKDDITKAFQAVGLDPADCKLVEMNCWTGQGLLELLDMVHSTIDEQKGRVFVELIRYQQERTPRAYINEIQQELMRQFTAVALEKPEADPAKNPLTLRAEEQQRFLADVLGHDLTIQETIHNSLYGLIEQITSGCTRQITEPIIARHSWPIYKDEPVYEKIEEQEPIYEKKPRYKWVKQYRDPENPFEVIEALRNLLNVEEYGIAKWKKVPDGYEEVCVGYKTREREVYKGTRQVISHYEDYKQVIGQRVVNTLYDPFGSKGVAFLATNSHFAVVPLHSRKPSKVVQQVYDSKLAQLSNFSIWSRIKDIEAELHKCQPTLFEEHFTTELEQALDL